MSLLNVDERCYTRTCVLGSCAAVDSRLVIGVVLSCIAVKDYAQRTLPGVPAFGVNICHVVYIVWVLCGEFRIGWCSVGHATMVGLFHKVQPKWASVRNCWGFLKHILGFLDILKVGGSFRSPVPTLWPYLNLWLVHNSKDG